MKDRLVTSKHTGENELSAAVFSNPAMESMQVLRVWDRRVEKEALNCAANKEGATNSSPRKQISRESS